MRHLVPIWFRLSRFELLVFAFLAVAAVSANVVVSLSLSGLHVPASCLAGGGSEAGGCASLGAFWNLSYGAGGILVAVVTFAPVLLGVMLGVPVVAGEVEDRSATVSWSLDPSRIRWTGGRALTLGIALIAMLAAVGISADLLEAARNPGIDPSASFADYGARGLPLVARGMAFFALGFFAGALIGRVLPGLIVAALLVGVLFAGVTVLRPMLGEPVLIEDGQMSADQLLTGMPYRGADGRLYSEEQLQAQSPEQVGTRAYVRWREANFEQVILALPAEQYGRVSLVETGLLLVVTTVAAAGALVVTSRRRPYL